MMFVVLVWIVDLYAYALQIQPVTATWRRKRKKEKIKSPYGFHDKRPMPKLTSDFYSLNSILRVRLFERGKKKEHELWDQGDSNPYYFLLTATQLYKRVRQYKQVPPLNPIFFAGDMRLMKLQIFVERGHSKYTSVKLRSRTQAFIQE